MSESFYIAGRRGRLQAMLALAGCSALLLSACSSAGAVSNGSEASAEEVYELSYSSALSAESPQGQLIDAWLDSVEDASNGSVAIERFYSGALLKPTDSLAGVGDGRADMAMTSPQYTPAELPLSTFTELPFASVNSEAFVKSVRDAYIEDDSFRSEWNDNGVEVMIFVPAGSNSIVAKEQVSGVAELSGLQVRAVGRTAAVLESVGAIPSAIALPEVYESLERGVVDAVSSIAVEVAKDIGATEAAPNVVDPGLGEYTVIPVFVNKDWWDELPGEVKAAFEAANNEYYEAVGTQLTEMQDNTCEQLTGQGVQFSVWPESESTELFEAGGKKQWDDWAATHSTDSFDGSAFLQSHEERIAKYAGESSYLPTIAQCMG